MVTGRPDQTQATSEELERRHDGGRQDDEGHENLEEREALVARAGTDR
jgi:hypothetical protein